MIRREVFIPDIIVKAIAEIVHRENHVALKNAFAIDQKSPVFLSEEEAEALILLAVIEKKKAQLRFPYYHEDHPNYSQEHEEAFDDVQMGIYEKTIYYVESAFKNRKFDNLL